MVATTDEVARALAKEFGIEEEANTKDPNLLERAKFTTLEKLHPGQDFKDGILYYTAPIFVDTTRTVGKGKKAREVPTVETHTACINSSEDLFLFDENELYERGFSYPKVFLAPDDNAWGGDILQTIASRRGQVPGQLRPVLQVAKALREVHGVRRRTLL